MRAPLLRNEPVRRSISNAPNCKTRLAWTWGAITASDDCKKCNTQLREVQRLRPGTDRRPSAFHSSDSNSRRILEREQLPCIDGHSKLNDRWPVHAIPREGNAHIRRSHDTSQFDSTCDLDCSASSLYDVAACVR